MKSLSITMIVKLPAVVGVPVITPVDGLIANAGDPGGKAVALHVYGIVPPVPLIVKEYGVPTTPGVTVLVVMLGFCAKASVEKLTASISMPKTSTATFHLRIISAEPPPTGEISQAGTRPSVKRLPAPDLSDAVLQARLSQQGRLEAPGFVVPATRRREWQ